MSTTDFSRNPENFCYRHPDRMSFALCQRCQRTICPECQTQAAVGVICPECLRDQKRARTPAQKRADRRWGRGGGGVAVVPGRAPVTTWILGITAGMFLLDLLAGLTGFSLSSLLSFWAPALYPQLGVGFEPWRLLTPLLVHSGFLHIALNLLSIWVIGRLLEPMLGPWRFLALYLVGGLGGSVAVALLAFGTPVVGASGALFGMLGALVVIGRQLGGNVTGILVLLGINLVIGFLVPGSISWQAHVGGLIAGTAVGFVYSRTRRPGQTRQQVALVALVVVALIGLLALPPVIQGF
ncbi:rhomboid family intramembrane serine protease [Microbacterium marinilacus]|uniref:Rhomboid family intramembrane serine protease n=1 Tax=Microbacterium marinilacus TaxID=415209 RepID=A0ABP7BLZ9_9MICO|nr:rhomboid family intramembrane serine protease [Microbacterium marinilacus]MBY0688406.1 rhomboid family intramembrane serine protease [Microbacterium marinilacus]